MKAAYLLNGKIECGELPDPQPGSGQVLVKTHSCGLCASDLHLKDHGRNLVEWSNANNGPFQIDLSQPLVMGHEYVGDILDFGPDTSRSLKKGTRVTSAPHLKTSDGIKIVGLSTGCPGGYGEYMLLQEDLLLPIPDVVDSDRAAMAEPVSVGIAYVRNARLTSDDTPLVIGCGAIGLSMIMALKHAGMHPIIASDYSADRRALALKAGADIVVDPAEKSPFISQETGGAAPNVIFECVGVPGVVNQIVESCAVAARIIVPGWCLEMDHLLTVCAHTKNLNLQFGSQISEDDFKNAVKALVEGGIDPSSWLGRRFGLRDLGAELDKVGDPANPIRAVVDPRLD